MPQLKKYKIGDVVESISLTHSFNKDKIIFLNTSDILEGKVLHENYSDVETLPGQAKKSIKKGDILFSEIRPGNKRFAFIDFDAEDYVVSTKLMVLRKKADVVDFGFFYKWLTSQPVLDEFQNIAESRSGTFPQITFDVIKDIEIDGPNEKESQTRIAAILSSLDDKIELNRRTNATLEAMAQTLFKKYFVENIDPDNLSEGWSLLTLGDSVSKSNTGADAIQKAPIVDYDTGIRCARVGDMTNKRPYHEWGFCEIEKDYYENFKLLKYDILITRTATLGINTIIWEDIDAVFNNGLIRIRINPDFNPLFVYQALQTKNYEIYIERISGDSSTRPNMQIQYLLDYPMLKPPKKLQDEFSNQIESLLSLKYLKENEIMQLAKLRDTLLPKLMSGEIEVNAAENELVS